MIRCFLVFKYFIVVTAFSFNANALSCKVPLEFILKCQNHFCTEGFFAFYKLSNNGCYSILNVKHDEIIYQFDISRSNIKIQSDGFYSVKTRSNALVRDNSGLEFERCYKLKDDGKYNLTCDPISITKLDFSNSATLQDVMNDYVDKSRVDKFWATLYGYSLPLLLLVLLRLRSTTLGIKHRRKLFAITIFFTVVGISQILIWGPPHWTMAGLLTALFLIFSGAWRLYKKVKSIQ